MRRRLAVVLTVLAVLAGAVGVGLMFADRVTTQFGIGAALAVAGVATWAIVTTST